jgi:SNF2 family DNA or RNA helicase
MGYELFRDMLSPQSKSSDDRDSRKLSIEDYEQYLLKGPDLVVADEAHRLKDKTSRLSECLNRIQTKRRIALTGSPLQNNLLEYFHMVIHIHILLAIIVILHEYRYNL